MKSRYKAEAQTMCDAGLASYLRDKHQSRVSKGVIAGLGTGTLVSLVFFGYSHYTRREDFTFLPSFAPIYWEYYRNWIRFSHF